MPQLTAVLGANVNPFEQGLKQAETALNHFRAVVNESADSKAINTLSDKIGSLIVPIGAAIAGAIGAKKALDAFADSRLPGAKEFTANLKAAKSSLTELSEAVGEYLAPAANFAANMIKKIADALTPVIRTFTAFSQSSGAFLEKLGSNFANAFLTLIPTAKAAVDWLKNLFTGPARNWQKDIDAFRKWWNDTWFAILKFT